ncbi:MAG: hypothetical protein ACPLPR_02280 [Bacillota bacterium]
MRRLKLLRLASFSGYGVDVTQNQPVVEVADKVAEKLLATGYFEDLGSVEAEENTQEAVETGESAQEAAKPKAAKKR